MAFHILSLIGFLYTDDDGRVAVSFHMPVKYVPRNSVAYYDALVLLNEGLVSYSPLANPPNYADSGREPEYELNLASEHLESWYRVERSSGAVLDSGHAQIVPSPEAEF